MGGTWAHFPLDLTLTPASRPRDLCSLLSSFHQTLSRQTVVLTLSVDTLSSLKTLGIRLSVV